MLETSATSSVAILLMEIDFNVHSMLESRIFTCLKIAVTPIPKTFLISKRNYGSKLQHITPAINALVKYHLQWHHQLNKAKDSRLSTKVKSESIRKTKCESKKSTKQKKMNVSYNVSLRCVHASMDRAGRFSVYGTPHSLTFLCWLIV